MNISPYKIPSFTAFIFIVFGSIAIGQVTSSISSSQTTTPEVLKTQDAVNKVLLDSGASFKEALQAYIEHNPQAAGEKFNKSVEVFLYSTLNIQKEPRLQSCYDQLIETVYRIEFPSTLQPPLIRNLSATCSWSVDVVLADKVASLVRPSSDAAVASTTVAAANSGQAKPADTHIGFNNQEFEPSPLDELSKIQLTSDEMQVENNPVAQAQYQYIQYAVANKSLGFTFQVHPMIQQYINYYRGRGRGTMEVGLYRSGMFMSMARRIFREEGVPENMAWLAQVESTWKPTALSWAAASGLW